MTKIDSAATEGNPEENESGKAVKLDAYHN